jgi:pectate lyase
MPEAIRPRRRGQRWLLAAGSAALVLTASVVYATSASAATLFSATFEDNSISSWSKSGGTWTVESDGSRVARQSNASSENARLFNGSTSWTAYSVQARVKPLSLGSGGFVGLLARASGSTKL